MIIGRIFLGMYFYFLDNLFLLTVANSMSSAPEVLHTPLNFAHDVNVLEEDDFLSRSAPLFTPSVSSSISFWFVRKGSV